MSKIKIVGHASGTGVLTIAAPNTNTDRTITIPDVTGTLLDSGSDLPAANLTGTIASARLPTSTDLPLAGGTMTGTITSTHTTALQLTNNTTSKIHFGDSGNASIGKIEYVHSSNHLAFKVNDAERMRIDSSGNVGIGTSSPGFKLDIQDSNYGVRINAAPGSNYVQIKLPTNEGGAIDNEKFIIAYNNAHSNTPHMLALKSNNSAGSVAFFTGDERMRIDASGNVGIGTTTPSEKLEVAGNISIKQAALLHSSTLDGRVSESKRWPVKYSSSNTHTVATVTSAGNGASNVAGFLLTYTYRTMYGFNGGGGGHGIRMISGRRTSSTDWNIDAETTSAVGDSPVPTLSCTNNGDGTATLKITNPSSAHSFGELFLMAWDCTIV